MAERTDARSHERRPGGSEGPPRWSGVVGSPAPEIALSAAEVWSRYHCPVCSHQDRVTLSGPSVQIECSHCRTPLVVSLPTPSSESASVRVAVDVPESSAEA